MKIIITNASDVPAIVEHGTKAPVLLQPHSGEELTIDLVNPVIVRAPENIAEIKAQVKAKAEAEAEAKAAAEAEEKAKAEAKAAAEAEEKAKAEVEAKDKAGKKPANEQ
jgi:hypothetical protein